MAGCLMVELQNNS
nr:unnamed protein product [Callosobruchus analis]